MSFSLTGLVTSYLAEKAMSAITAPFTKAKESLFGHAAPKGGDGFSLFQPTSPHSEPEQGEPGLIQTGLNLLSSFSQKCQLPEKWAQTKNFVTQHTPDGVKDEFANVSETIQNGSWGQRIGLAATGLGGAYLGSKIGGAVLGFFGLEGLGKFFGAIVGAALSVMVGNNLFGAKTQPQMAPVQMAPTHGAADPNKPKADQPELVASHKPMETGTLDPNAQKPDGDVAGPSMEKPDGNVAGPSTEKPTEPQATKPGLVGAHNHNMPATRSTFSMKGPAP